MPDRIVRVVRNALDTETGEVHDMALRYEGEILVRCRECTRRGRCVMEETDDDEFCSRAVLRRVPDNWNPLDDMEDEW